MPRNLLFWIFVVGNRFFVLLVSYLSGLAKCQMDLIVVLSGSYWLMGESAVSRSSRELYFLWAVHRLVFLLFRLGPIGIHSNAAKLNKPFCSPWSHGISPRVCDHTVCHAARPCFCIKTLQSGLCFGIDAGNRRWVH